MLYLNATLQSAIANGSLTAALQAAGVNTTGAELPVPPVVGAQLHVIVQCPDGAVGANATLLPNVTTMLTNVAPGVLDASPLLLDNASDLGLGNISGVVVSLTAIVGACMR